MGEAKSRKKRFLTANPHCCFCGGGEAATTIDHVPPRTCFPDRVAPEGFEFPACERCQSASRQDELALGFYVRLVDPDDANYRPDESTKALLGLKNNLPHLMPCFDLSPSEKRRAYRDYDIPKPVGLFSSELPVVGVPEEAHEHVLRYARKMAVALFYREMGRAAPIDYFVWATWTQEGNCAHMNAWARFFQMTPLLTLGQRTNLDFGDRFKYQCNKKADPDLFAAIAQFGRGMALAMSVVNSETRTRMGDYGWVAVRDIYPTRAV